MTDECAIEKCHRPRTARGLCQSHYYKAKRAGTLDEIAPAPVTPCEHCGGPIPKGRRWGARFCSTTCKQAKYDAEASAAAAARREARVQSCAWCREPLTPAKRYGAKFCSPGCGTSWSNHQRSLVALQARKTARKPCEVCGRPIPESRRRDATYCSRKCKVTAKGTGHAVARRERNGYNRQRLYGLTGDEFAALLASQGGRCAICHTDEWTGKGPHVDHDHVTGLVRGVLCHKCNLGLGKFNDDPALVQAAMAYLSKE